MILYFSGTGNSRYLARRIAAQLDDTAVDATVHIKQDAHPQFHSDTPYVFIAPVYAWRLPRIFAAWIQKCRFTGNQKAYFVLTCGDSIGAADDYAAKFAQKVGFSYMGTAAIIMPENYIVMFEAPPPEQDEPIIAAATAQLEALSRQILVQEPLAHVRAGFVGHLCSDIVNPLFYSFYIGAKKFYTTDACISCGLCEEVCMLNNITLQNGRPVWGKDCTHCMACIARCPRAAIEYGKHTKSLRRYICPKE